jgi:two-component system alkaline phosphatase synthesis response regulator PhoP
MAVANLLIITRDTEARQDFCDTLIEKDLECSLVTDTNGVSEVIAEQQPDVILLEIAKRWPNEEMRGLIRRVKRERNLPVIVLIAEDALDDLQDEADFDDFLLSPYHTAEAVFRINRLVEKHRKATSNETIEYNGLQLDLGSCEVTVDNRLIELTFKEYELLKLMARNRGRVFTREELLDKIWGYDYFGGDRTVDVHIRRLRSKIEDTNHTFVDTVRNIGYRFRK